MNTYFGDKSGDFNILKEIESKGEEDSGILIAGWKSEIAMKLSHNLNLVMKKDNLLSHFMRVIPIPFKEIFQSELYSF